MIDAAALLVGTRLSLTVVGVVARSLLSRFHGNAQHSPTGLVWLDVWAAWDVGWYLRIVEHGYPTVAFDPHRQDVFAFFPMFPWLARALHMAGVPPLVAGLLVSNAALFAAAVFLHRLVRIDHNDDVARRAVRYLFAFPSAFILSAMLTESLFLALALGSLYLVRRGRLREAAVALFALGMTRTTGVVITLPVLLELAASKRRDGSALLTLAAAPAGVGAVMLMNWDRTGDALAFVHIQVAWGRAFANPLIVVRDALVGSNVPGGLETHARFAMIFTLSCLALLIAAWREGVRRSYVAFGLVVVLIPLSQSWYGTMRYVLGAFPIYIACALLAVRYRRADEAAIVGSAILQGLLMAFWTTSHELVV